MKAVNRTACCSGPYKCAKCRSSSVNLSATVKAAVARVAAICQPSLAQEVEQELEQSGNQGIGVLLNETTGKTHTFAAPVSYAVPPAKKSLGQDASVADLEKEIAKLTASLTGLKTGPRSKVEHQIRVYEQQLVKARGAVEANRRNTERAQERGPQQYGASAAGAAPVVAPKAAAPKRKTAWGSIDELLADLDTKHAAKMLEVVRGGGTSGAIAPPMAHRR